ncbi:hypothetical protein ACQ4N7_02100 [Nodosilinea sp. AN01ver1]|uniref:hypothetical protein n=1 Tax=Nodosilinea sp. AN01ver1 TaxID=3423362 RepID=UPI003D3223C2
MDELTQPKSYPSGSRPGAAAVAGAIAEGQAEPGLQGALGQLPFWPGGDWCREHAARVLSPIS